MLGGLALRSVGGYKELGCGYLVVFDGRLEDIGRTILETTEEAVASVHKVRGVFVDVRPRWSKRTNSRRTAR